MKKSIFSRAAVAVILAVAVSGIFIVSVQSDGSEGYDIVDKDGFHYTTSGTTATVTGANKTSIVNEKIPSSVTYGGVSYTVTAIGSSAFQGSKVTNLFVPNTVTSIGTGAFKNATLTNVTFINVNSIGNEAFYNAKLTNIAFINVDSIGSEAFYNSKLVNVTFPGSIKTIGNSAFAYSNITNISFGNSLTTIGTEAFFNTKLVNISIPGSVKVIGARAFANSSLVNVTIGSGVQTIGDGAFTNTKLVNVTLPNTVVTVGKGAFDTKVSVTYSGGSTVTVTHKVTLQDNDIGITGFQVSTDGITYTAYNGSVVVQEGGTLFIKATVASGYSFTQWAGGVTESTYKITNINSDVTYTPTSTKNSTSGVTTCVVDIGLGHFIGTYIETSKDGLSWMYYSSPVTVNKGESLFIKATFGSSTFGPNDERYLVIISEDNTETPISNPYKVVNIQSDINLHLSERVTFGKGDGIDPLWLAVAGVIAVVGVAGIAVFIRLKN